MRKKKSIFKRIIIFLLLAITILGTSYYFYNTYQSIDLTTEYNTSKLNTVITKATTGNTETNNNIVDTLENISRCVVGISKIETHSNSIFSSNSITELGLGTGVIVTDNGYILSNSHVTGEKYSKCYITLENGNKYDGTVVWSDKDLDLSITKINAKNLEYAELGDSDEIRVGETVYAIRKPNRI